MLVLLLFACDKKEVAIEEKPIEPFIKKYLPQEEKCSNDIFVSFSMNDKHYKFLLGEQAISYSIEYPSSQENIKTGAYYLSDTITKNKVSIVFYFTYWNKNVFKTGDYYYADPWENQVGVNVEFYTPYQNIPHAYNLYLGHNTKDSYFRITYIDKERLCGSFKTIWKECCEGDLQEYNVEGEFSIPNLAYKFSN